MGNQHLHFFLNKVSTYLGYVRSTRLGLNIPFGFEWYFILIISDLGPIFNKFFFVADLQNSYFSGCKKLFHSCCLLFVLQQG